MSFWSIIVIVNCPTRWSLLMLIGYWCRSYIIIYFTTQITEKYSTAMCYRCDQPTKPSLWYIPNCCCRERIEFSSLDSSLVPLWGWILQTVVDFLGTSLQQVKICTHITTEKLRFKRLSGNSARYELATRSVVSVLIFTLVCIYVANIGLSYAEAKERQSLNASRMFRHIQTWNIQIWHIYFCLKYL